MKKLYPWLLALVVVGALNWGLMAFLNVDLVKVVSMGSDTVMKVLYGVVALAALVVAWQYWGKKV